MTITPIRRAARRTNFRFFFAIALATAFAAVGPTRSISLSAAGATSIWQPTDLPSVASIADPNPYELGVKFTSDVDGFITGIRFYKGTANIGVHVGHLWASDGTLLASATFNTETDSGWQQVNFASAVHITANAVYVASYHTDGNYAVDNDYFSIAGHDSPPLHALSTAAAGGNGVYASGQSAFPTNSFRDSNYWVDVVFSDATVDPTPLAISNINVQLLDGSNAIVTWNTSKNATSRIDYSIDQNLPPASTQTVSDGAFVTSHGFHLTGLTAEATYYFSVTAVDQGSNTLTVPGPSFTMPGPTLRDTLLSDFLAGTTGAGAYLAQTADGEVTLAPANGAEFSGPGLPPGWIEFKYSSQGSATFANGRMAIDGERVATCMTNGLGACIPDDLAPSPVGNLAPGQSVEFSANFSGGAFQHAGFAQLLNDAEPWAMFSTATGGTLKARTSTGIAQSDFDLGPSYLGAFHRYRIDWNAASVDYYIDGALVHSEPQAVPGPMRLLAGSDFNPGGGAVVVDWMRLRPYAAAGTFTSRIFNAQSMVQWNAIQWVSQVPPGTSLAISVRAGNSPTVGASWTAFTPISSPGPISLPSTYQYIQYRADMTGDTTNTPELDEIVLSGSTPVSITPTITWPNPAPITYGTALSSAQLNAVATASGSPVSGTFVYAPPAGTVLSAGNKSLQVTFTPDDQVHYVVATATAQITVNPAPSTTVATTSNSPWLFSLPVTLKATVSPAAATGGVTFMDGATTLACGAGSVATAPVATCVTSTLALGNHSITAVYSGSSDGNYSGSTSAALTQSIVAPVTNPTINAADVAVIEGNTGFTQAIVNVTLSGGTLQPVTVKYATADGSAVANSDYVAASGTLTFQPGETLKTVALSVVGDTIAEATETFVLNLSSATNGTIGKAQATITIIDDDSTSWVNSTVADFGAGTVGTGAYISSTSDGEVILAPTVGSEFLGSSLDPGWTSSILASGGFVTTGNGKGAGATLKGAAIVGGTGYAPERSLEFVAVFASVAGEYVGFMANATLNALTAPHAVFGLRVDKTLVARTFMSGSAVETTISGLKGNAHKFRIDWKASSVVYWIDDTKVATHAVAISQAMKPTAMNQTTGGGALTVDYMRMTPYAAAGTYTSKVFDAGGVVNWSKMTWTSTLPASTTIVFQYSVGNTPTPDATWTPFTNVPAAGALTGSSRYFQFVIKETTGDPGQTPVVSSVTTAFVR
jgi:hypothetical protein